MNACELHDLYAPLWEKVPETKPAGLTYSKDARPSAREHCSGPVLPEHRPSPGFAHENCAGMVYDGPCACIADEAAAALCRVAVEDWIIARNGAPQYTVLNGEYTVWLNNSRLNLPLGQWYFPTIHHALVQAAMDLHEALAPANCSSN